MYLYDVCIYIITNSIPNMHIVRLFRTFNIQCMVIRPLPLKVFDCLHKAAGCYTVYTESQNFLDPGSAEPYSWLDLGFENTHLGFR